MRKSWLNGAMECLQTSRWNVPTHLQAQRLELSVTCCIVKRNHDMLIPIMAANLRL